jgi:hypothetical protein
MSDESNDKIGNRQAASREPQGSGPKDPARGRL